MGLHWGHACNLCKECYKQVFRRRKSVLTKENSARKSTLLVTDTLAVIKEHVKSKMLKFTISADFFKGERGPLCTTTVSLIYGRILLNAERLSILSNPIIAHALLCVQTKTDVGAASKHIMPTGSNKELCRNTLIRHVLWNSTNTSQNLFLYRDDVKPGGYNKARVFVLFKRAFFL